jgi:hypothetical protein
MGDDGPFFGVQKLLFAPRKLPISVGLFQGAIIGTLVFLAFNPQVVVAALPILMLGGMMAYITKVQR